MDRGENKPKNTFAPKEVFTMRTRRFVLTSVLVIAALLLITAVALAAPRGPVPQGDAPRPHHGIPVGSAWGAIVGERGAAHNVMLPIGDRVPSFTVMPGTRVRLVAEATGIWFPRSEGTLSARLEVFQADADGNLTPLGQDEVSDTRTGPHLARKRLVVPIAFEAPGEMEIVVRLTSRAEPVQGTPAEDVDEVRAHVTVLDPATFGSISGTVTAADTSEPLANVTVIAGNRELRIRRNARTDEQGNYTITGLPPGEYLVGARASGTPYVGEFYDGARSPDEATPVTVNEAGETTGIDFTLDRGGSITGQVVAEDTDAPLAGVAIVIRPVRPQPGASVERPEGAPPAAGLMAPGAPKPVPAAPPQGRRHRRHPRPAAITDENGMYTVQGLPAGEYIVVAIGVRQGYGVEFYQEAASPEDATPVAVELGQTVEGINFTLAPRSPQPPGG